MLSSSASSHGMYFHFSLFYDSLHISFLCVSGISVHAGAEFLIFSCLFFFIDLRGSDMEKEKQDGSSPRGVIEACLQGLESDLGSTKDSTAVSGEHHSNSRALSNWSRFFKSWKKLSPKRLSSWIPPPVPKATKSKSTKENPVLRDLYNFKSKLQHFTFAELKIATDDFSQGQSMNPDL